MAAIAVLVFLVVLSAFTIKVGTVALRMTGMNRSTAAFQALSAYTGTGFTTGESEMIVNHPRRRRIVRMLMILGSAGLASTVATLILGFKSVDEWEHAWRRLAILGVALLLLWCLAIGRRVNRFLDRLIANRLGGVEHLGVYELNKLLSLKHGYSVSAIQISEGNAAIGKTLRRLAWGEKGMFVLSIERSHRLIPMPGASITIEANDRLICFGNVAIMQRIALREAAEEQEATT